MPIVWPAEQDSPLRQGDILRGVALTVTSVENKVATLDGGWALVVSRNCNALRDETIVVARVVAKGVQIQSGESFEAYRKLFARLRDGDGYPDDLYLGQLDPRDPMQRYRAKLDSLHSIQLPGAGAAREAFLRDRRVYHLDAEFIHDLHVRLTSAFARRGFDDYGWYTDQDLQMVLSAGNRELEQARAELQTEKARLADVELSRVQAEDRGDNRTASNLSRELTKSPTALEKLEKKVADLELAVQKYRAEREKRASANRAAASGEVSSALVASSSPSDAQEARPAPAR